MMALYAVKAPLYGVPMGTVERFASFKAGPLMLSGAIEPYDPAKHAGLPGAPDKVKPQRQPAGR